MGTFQKEIVLYIFIIYIIIIITTILLLIVKCFVQDLRIFFHNNQDNGIRKAQVRYTVGNVILLYRISEFYSYFRYLQ